MYLPTCEVCIPKTKPSGQGIWPKNMPIAKSKKNNNQGLIIDLTRRRRQSLKTDARV